MNLLTHFCQDKFPKTNSQICLIICKSIVLLSAVNSQSDRDQFGGELCVFFAHDGNIFLIQMFLCNIEPDTHSFLKSDFLLRHLYRFVAYSEKSETTQFNEAMKLH